METVSVSTMHSWLAESQFKANSITQGLSKAGAEGPKLLLACHGKIVHVI